MFVLDPTIGSFVLVKRQIRIPTTGKIYSVNEANRRSFPEGFNRYLDWAHANGYSSRYIGSMVADVHRTLLKGGVFMYPPTAKNPEGKLRLMYEGNPMAMIVEQAGGKGDGRERRRREHSRHPAHWHPPANERHRRIGRGGRPRRAAPVERVTHAGPEGPALRAVRRQGAIYSESLSLPSSRPSSFTP
jgi:hypothetical protein